MKQLKVIKYYEVKRDVSVLANKPLRIAVAVQCSLCKPNKWTEKWIEDEKM